MIESAKFKVFKYVFGHVLTFITGYELISLFSQNKSNRVFG